MCLYVLVFSMHPGGCCVQKRKAVVFLNPLSKLYVRVDRVQMVNIKPLFYGYFMELFHVIFL